MKIVVLGAVGRMAVECTRDLLRTGRFDEIVLADANLGLLQQVADEFRDPRVSLERIDAANVADLERVMAGCDLFVNGMPSDFSAKVTEAAIRLRISGTDITGLADMFEYHERAAAAGILIVAGLGCTPGITNVLARHGADQLEAVDEVVVNFAAWRPIAMSPGLVDFTIWALRPDTPERCYFEDGRFVPAAPFSGRREVRFAEPIGEQVVYCLPHQETVTIPRYIPCRKVVTLGTYPPEDMELFRYLWKYGFLDDRPVAGGLSPLEFVRAHLKQAPQARELALWHYALVVEVSGTAEGRQVTHRMSASHPSMATWGGPSVYAKFTGIPLSLGSQMLAEGKVTGRGVLAPEACVPPGEFLKRLRERGLVFEFEVR